MKNYTAEQLKSLSREELIEEILKQQTEYNVLLQRLTAFNSNTFGRKSEQMEYDGQESLFNEVEAVCEESGEEPRVGARVQRRHPG